MLTVDQQLAAGKERTMMYVTTTDKNRYIELCIEFCYVDDSAPRGYTAYRDGHKYKRLRLECLFCKGSSSWIWGIRVKTDRQQSLSVDTLEPTIKTIKSITRRLAKLAEKEGCIAANDSAEFIRRVARLTNTCLFVTFDGDRINRHMPELFTHINDITIGIY